VAAFERALRAHIDDVLGAPQASGAPQAG